MSGFIHDMEGIINGSKQKWVCPFCGGNLYLVSSEDKEHRIGCDGFVRRYVPARSYNDVDTVLQTINSFGCGEMWQDASPIWYRPQYYEGRLYKPRKLLQVVGHTPVEAITRKGNLISCDVFSTDRDRKPLGTQEYLVIETRDWVFKGEK